MKSFRRPLRVFAKIIFVIAVIYVLVVVGVMIYTQVHNDMIFRSASPTMKKLASEAGMSHDGELLFYSTHPQLDSLEQLARDCSSKSANDGYVEQGCFDPSTNRIYIRQMPDDLKDVEIVTAAHEMLHVAYGKLTSSDRAKVDKLVEKDYKDLANDKLSARMKEYAHLEPGARDNELHSIIGTEYKNLTPALENYYQKYFISRQNPVAANQKVTDTFKKQQNKLAYMRGVIAQLESDAKMYYADSVSAARAGDASSDQYYYDLYTAKVDQINSEIDAYNQLLRQYNALSAEYNGQPSNTIAPVSPHQSS